MSGAPARLPPRAVPRYPLAATLPPTPEQVARVVERFRAAGVAVHEEAAARAA